MEHEKRKNGTLGMEELAKAKGSSLSLSFLGSPDTSLHLQTHVRQEGT